MISKIVLSVIATFLFITGIYLIVTNQKIEGTYYNSRNGQGWVHNSLNGYFLLIIASGFLIALISVYRRKKIIADSDADKFGYETSEKLMSSVMENTPAGRHPLNKGDFYIQNETCQACGAPQAEAPDIIEHAPDNHCYFKKQPVTEDEIDQAINAMMVSCIDALRYGGQDEQMLKRLYEDGIGHLCDYHPQGKYHILIRDRVQFGFNDTLEALELFLLSSYRKTSPYIRIEDHQSNKTDRFNFTQQWMSGVSGVVYNGHLTGDNQYELQITPEKDRHLNSIIGFSVMLYDILKADNRITNMVWFEHGSNETEYKKPF